VYIVDKKGINEPLASIQDIVILLTVALEALVYETVQQRAAVVTECWTAVSVCLELVPVRRLQRQLQVRPSHDDVLTTFILTTAAS